MGVLVGVIVFFIVPIGRYFLFAYGLVWSVMHVALRVSPMFVLYAFSPSYPVCDSVDSVNLILDNRPTWTNCDLERVEWSGGSTVFDQTDR